MMIKYGMMIGLMVAMTGIALAQSPSDRAATQETKDFYGKLFKSIEKGTMIGHQDALAYGHGWYGEPDRSDVKDVVGQHPVIVGWELGDLELGNQHNLDKVYFDDMRRFVQQTHKRGGFSMFSWHGNNIATGGNSWDCQQDTIVRSILPGGIHHQEYLTWLDRLADFFLSLKDDAGQCIPVVFRPYHEHTGSWFWWGAKQCSPEEYKALWRMTIRHLRDIRHVHHILYSYSTAEIRDEAHFLERYPGDDLVDILAFDAYVPNKGEPKDVERYVETMHVNLDVVTEYAHKSGKIASIGETGYEGVKDPTFFTRIVYPLLEDRKVAWVLFWRNAYEEDKPHHHYLPFKGHPAARDFRRFFNKKKMLNKF